MKVCQFKQFPARRVRQMAKKLEGSQATAKHMKQVTNELHATQNKPIETSKNRVTTKQGTKKTEQV